MRIAKLPLVLAALFAAAVHADAAGSSAHLLRADVLRTMEGTEKKLIGLAEATPAEKMTYRPAEGVRSMSEVLLHSAGANYFFMTFVGAKMPEGMGPGFDKKTTDKAQIVAELKKSFEYARQVIEKLNDADLAKPIKMFGQDSHVQTALLVYANHMHEHLGQAIAYARANGVVPPWSKGKAD